MGALVPEILLSDNNEILKEIAEIKKQISNMTPEEAKRFLEYFLEEESKKD